MTRTFTVFQSDRRLAAGALPEVLDRARGGALVFDDATGELVKLTRPQEIEAALAAAEGGPPTPTGPPVTLEVAVLPRHLAWLEAQPAGPAATLRRLIDVARRSGEGRPRQAREAAYRFLSMMGGDRPGFEAASRALFAGDGAGLADAMAGWPGDLADYALALAADGLD